jgi:hypothetical protein
MLATYSFVTVGGKIAYFDGPFAKISGYQRPSGIFTTPEKARSKLALSYSTERSNLRDCISGESVSGKADDQAHYDNQVRLLDSLRLMKVVITMTPVHL